MGTLGTSLYKACHYAKLGGGNNVPKQIFIWEHWEHCYG